MAGSRTRPSTATALAHKKKIMKNKNETAEEEIHDRVMLWAGWKTRAGVYKAPGAVEDGIRILPLHPPT